MSNPKRGKSLLDTRLSIKSNGPFTTPYPPQPLTTFKYRNRDRKHSNCKRVSQVDGENKDTMFSVHCSRRKWSPNLQIILMIYNIQAHINSKFWTLRLVPIDCKAIREGMLFRSQMWHLSSPSHKAPSRIQWHCSRGSQDSVNQLFCVSCVLVSSG